MGEAITGFSKLSKEEKIGWIAKTFFDDPESALSVVRKYVNADADLQQLHDGFTENAIGNFYLPLAVAPNFLINGRYFTVPMVIEESSVVAAASKAAKFWAARGGFRCTVVGTQKVGQVHIIYNGPPTALRQLFEKTKPRFFAATESLTRNMRQRGGGISDIELRDRTVDLEGYYQLHATFETKDSMGANFINSCLEQFASTFKDAAANDERFAAGGQSPEIVMSILSNYVPDCVVHVEVSCAVTELADKTIPDPQTFAQRFVEAIKIAEVEPYRAVTHNKGIMNGIDAVVLATGNDFRAIEAGAHAFASRDGRYQSLSHASVDNGVFRFWLDIPLAIGTVGGLTSLHPMAKFALQMLENPSAPELMQIVAAVGLAQNFAAVRSLTTTGIQHGHMKMHLNNMLMQHHASESETAMAKKHFKSNQISHAAVVEFLHNLRSNP